MNLHLSVIRDGTSYQARRHAAARHVEGTSDKAEYLKTIRDICNTQAQHERAEFGTKYKPTEITQAAKLVADYMADDRHEEIASQYDSSTIRADMRRWWDKVNGNSYFSVRVRVGQCWFKVPMQYGSGSQPEWETLYALQEMGIVSRDVKSPGDCNIEFIDFGYGLKGSL